MEPGSVQNGMDYDLNMEPLVKKRTGNQTMITMTFYEVPVSMVNIKYCLVSSDPLLIIPDWRKEGGQKVEML